MARYTSIYSSIWDNPQLQRLLKNGGTPTIVLYFYLLTNSSTNIIGYYQLSLVGAGAYLATSEEEIISSIKKLEEIGLVMYEGKTSNILLLDFFSHNSFPKGEKQIKSMLNQLRLIKRNSLDNFFIQQVCKYAEGDIRCILDSFPKGMCEKEIRS